MLLSVLLLGANSALLPEATPSRHCGVSVLLLLPMLAPLMLLERCMAVPLASPCSVVWLLAAGLTLPGIVGMLLLLLFVGTGDNHAVCCRQKQMASALKLRSSTKGRCSSLGSATHMLLITACRSFWCHEGGSAANSSQTGASGMHVSSLASRLEGVEGGSIPSAERTKVQDDRYRTTCTKAEDAADQLKAYLEGVAESQSKVLWAQVS